LRLVRSVVSAACGFADQAAWLAKPQAAERRISLR
jgi:hypothetical protein